MRWYTILALLFSLGVASTATAQSDPFDWSEYRQKLFDWPADEVEFFVEEEGGHIVQNYRLQISRDELIEILADMQANREELGNNYFVLGRSHQNNPKDRWQITVGRRQLMLIANVYDEGSTTLIQIESNPIPVISGYFKRSLYSYRLPGDTDVPARILQPTMY